MNAWVMQQALPLAHENHTHNVTHTHTDAASPPNLSIVKYRAAAITYMFGVTQVWVICAQRRKFIQLTTRNGGAP